MDDLESELRRAGNIGVSDALPSVRGQASKKKKKRRNESRDSINEIIDGIGRNSQIDRGQRTAPPPPTT